MEKFGWNWEFDFKYYQLRTFEDISNQDIIDAFEADASIIEENKYAHYSEFSYFLFSFVNNKFIVVLFKYRYDKIFILNARKATKGEIERLFDF